MNIVLILSLFIPAVIAIIQIFLTNDKRAWRIILTVLSVVALGFVYYKAQDDDKENAEMKKKIENTENLARLDKGNWRINPI